MRPTIIIGEIHPDPAARQLVHNNLEFFENEGYHVFAFEHDSEVNLTSEIRFLQNYIQDNEKFLPLFDALSTQEKIENFVAFWSFPANRVLLNLFQKLESSSTMRYQGLDKLGVTNRWAISRAEIENLAAPEKNDLREENMANELLRISEQGSGIAIVGLKHLQGIQEKIIQKIGFEEAYNRFTILLPYSCVIPTTPLDNMMSLIHANDVTNLEKVIPLRKCNFFGIEPVAVADYGVSLNQRFKYFIQKECFKENVKKPNSDCCRQYTNYLLSFFTPNKAQYSEAINQYIESWQAFQKLLVKSQLNLGNVAR